MHNSRRRSSSSSIKTAIPVPPRRLSAPRTLLPPSPLLRLPGLGAVLVAPAPAAVAAVAGDSSTTESPTTSAFTAALTLLLVVSPLPRAARSCWPEGTPMSACAPALSPEALCSPVTAPCDELCVRFRSGCDACCWEPDRLCDPDFNGSPDANGSPDLNGSPDPNGSGSGATSAMPSLCSGTAGACALGTPAAGCACASPADAAPAPAAVAVTGTGAGAGAGAGGRLVACAPASCACALVATHTGQNQGSCSEGMRSTGGVRQNWCHPLSQPSLRSSSRREQ